MSEVLYINGSPRMERSFSVALAQAFLDAYRKKNPADEIKTVDVFKTRIPVFDGATLEAKYAILHGQNPTAEQRTAWKPVEDLIAEFKSADKYVLAVPMWNFGIPYRLKQYIDNLIQPGYTFSFSPAEGYKGLVTGKPVFIAYARGGIYGEDVSFDFQKRYMELNLNFIGFTDIRSLVIEGTLMRSKEEIQPIKEALLGQARKMAEIF
jgi:FMN-dependent NADH-azoreductase